MSGAHYTHQIISGPAAADISPSKHPYFSLKRNGECFENVYVVIERHESRGERQLMTGTFVMGGETVSFQAVYYPNMAEEVMGEMRTEVNLSMLKTPAYVRRGA